MAERVLVMLLTGAALFAINVKRVRNSSPRERWVLAAFGVPALYFAMLFATDYDRVNLHDLANASVGRIARILVKWFEQS